MNFDLFRVLVEVNPNVYWFIGIFSIVIFLGVIGAFLTVFLTRRFERVYFNSLKRKFNANRTFIIDIKSQSVEYFSLRNLKEIKKISYNEFLNMLVEKEQNNFNNWLIETTQTNGALTPDSAILVTDIIVKEDNKSFCSRILFKAKAVDKAKGIVYLDSILLSYLPSEYNRIKKGAIKKDIFSLSEIARFYAHGHFQKGSMYVIDFYKKPNTNPRINEYEFRYIILNAIYKTRNASSYFALFNSNNPLELSLLSSKQLNDFQINREIKSIIKIIDETLEVHGYKSFYEFTIVGSRISELDNDFVKAYDTMSNISRLTRESHKESLVYKNSDHDNRNVEDSYKAEVNRIIKLQNVVINYCPLVKIATKKVLTLGYIATVKPKGSMIDNIEDCKRYAKKYNLDKELFSMISRKMIPTFNNQKDNNNLKLFIPIKINEIQYVLKSLPHMNLATNTKIALVIENNEFVDVETNNDLLNSIKAMQSRDYEVFIQMKHGDYNLRSVTYSMFDGFLINTKSQSQNKGENRDFLIARSMIDKLIKFKEPIISIGTTSWSEIELLVKSGIYLFSSEVISENSTMLVPIDKKVSRKLLNMYKK